MQWFVLAAIAELGGCYAIWLWAREGRSAWLIGAATCSLLLFAWALTRTPTPFAGRAFAAYGGVYLVVALVWGMAVDGFRPDRWDITGACLALAGAGIMMFAPRLADREPPRADSAIERAHHTPND